jgi:hypothetical protein
MGQVIIAADSGNAVQKIAILRDGKQQFRQSPSLITEVDATNQGRDVFRFVRGGNSWSGRSWMRGGNTMIRDSALGKIDLGLPLLLSAVWGDLQGGDLVRLLLSVHNPDAFRDSLIKAYRGAHVIEHRGQKKAFVVEPLGVAQEGIGAILIAKAQSPSTMLIDLGAGTAILTLFAGVGCFPNTAAYPIDGLGSIYIERRLKTCATVSRALGRVLTPEEARTIVATDNHTLKLTPSNCGCANCEPIEVDLSAEVEKVAADWVAEVCRRAREQFGVEIISSTKWVACGGSCLIPAVRRCLEQSGVQVLPNPQTANALGLAAIAKSKVAA